MINSTKPPTGPATALRCPRCLGTLFSRPEDGSVGCKACRNQNYFVPTESLEHPLGKPSWLTVCCRKPIGDFSQMTYTCPEHAFRHILPLDLLEFQVRARVESPAARQQLADQSRGFGRGLIIAVLAIMIVVAIALARQWR
jgi:hypothetical protein